MNNFATQKHTVGTGKHKKQGEHNTKEHVYQRKQTEGSRDSTLMYFFVLFLFIFNYQRRQQTHLINIFDTYHFNFSSRIPSIC